MEEQILNLILSELREVKQNVNVLGTKIDKLDVRMDNLETRMDSLETKVDSLETKVDGLEVKMDRQFKQMALLIHEVEEEIVSTLTREIRQVGQVAEQNRQDILEIKPLVIQHSYDISVLKNKVS